MELNIY